MFPVVYGEFGSALEEERDLRVCNSRTAMKQASVELRASRVMIQICELLTASCFYMQWLNDIVAYMKNEGAGADGQHSAIDSWFWYVCTSPTG